ncbi:hypothetical protein N9Y42_03230 [Mariniblastus sp.]|nr:hypothetical protein [Mariniblastus sp.]
MIEPKNDASKIQGLNSGNNQHINVANNPNASSTTRLRTKYRHPNLRIGFRLAMQINLPSCETKGNQLIGYSLSTRAGVFARLTKRDVACHLFDASRRQNENSFVESFS